MDIFLQQIINGLVLGSVYALVALGYTMVYGIIQLINFAHGDIFMVGTYLSLAGAVFLLGLPLKLPLVVVFLGAMTFSMLLTALLATLRNMNMNAAPNSRDMMKVSRLSAQKPIALASSALCAMPQVPSGNWP